MSRYLRAAVVLSAMPQANSHQKAGIKPVSSASQNSAARRHAREAGQLRRALLSHLNNLGLATNGANGPNGAHPVAGTRSKDAIRAIHYAHRQQSARAEQHLLQRHGPRLLTHFATGREIDVAQIAPYLVEVQSDTLESNLFRIATLLWSIPVSRGYGRRLRFLVRDGYNDRLIGILALGDPVFNLSCRDEWIGWDVHTRQERLVNVMDAYVLGAVPPYNQLIGGKLVAALVAAREVNQVFTRKYGAAVGLISGEPKRPRLALVTTTSALGRSSLYNRLRLPDLVEFLPLGHTKGWGHFQVPDELFQRMRALLAASGHPYASGHQYGDGPNWRVRTIRAALGVLGLPEDLLRHGIQREAYAVPLARNAREYLRGEHVRPHFELASAAEIGVACVERWMAPRAERDPSYQHWTHEDLWAALNKHFATDAGA